MATAIYELEDGTFSEPAKFADLNEFVNWVLEDDYRSRKVLWFAHNAEYDWRYLIPHFNEYLVDYDIIPCPRGINKFYELKFTRKGQPRSVVLKMRDSLAVFPMSLDEFAKKFSTKQKLDIGLKKGTVFDPDNPQHVEYAVRDVEALLESICKFDELIYESFGIHLKGTIASTAYNAWLRTIPEGHAYPQIASRKVEDFMRKCYYGGIVHIRDINTYFPAVRTFDINSSYPNCMQKHGVPFGRPIDTDTYKEDCIGFYRCKVSNADRPDRSFYFIPYRSDDKTKGTTWARGEFETYITSIEIEEGRRMGYEIEVIEGFYFDEAEFPFEDYVSICKRLRKENKGQALEVVAKLMQNSLYGKFGTSRDGQVYTVCAEIPDEDSGWRVVVDNDTGDIAEYFYCKDEERDAPYMLPHWAAWITACARMELLNVQVIAGNENFIYADTDSVTILPIGVDRLYKAGLVGNDYGQIKDEGEKRDYVVFGPKAYSWYNEGADVPSVKMKGIPKSALTAEIAIDIHKGKMPSVNYHTSYGLLAAMKRGKLGIDTHRKPTNCANLQSWEIDDSNTLALPRKLGVNYAEC